MKAIVALIAFLILGFVSEIHSQAITAQFSVTTARFNSGFFTGTFYYDWTKNAMKLSFPISDQYSELYLFNSKNGYGGLATGQYSGQYLYKSSVGCSCETTRLNRYLPYFGDPSTLSTYWTDTGRTAVYNGITGKEYSPVTPPPIGASLLTSAWFSSSGNLLAFLMTDARLFTLDQSTYKSSTDSSVFAPPSDCKCGKPLDLVISLDRTGSISYNEWLIEHDFTRNLTKMFDYGPLKTNLAITDWNRQHWVTIPLNSGTSAVAVSNAVESMGCCPGSGGSCCCCGTDIGGGLYKAGQMLSTSSRPTATKVIVLLTDGCQNHIFDDATDTAIPCSCGSEQACATDATCIGDITTHYNNLKILFPNLKVMIVGVGPDLCQAQLRLAAGGIDDNVFSSSSWEALTSLVTSLSATACSTDDDICSGCCGMCSCGNCIPPPACLDPDDKCNQAAPDPTAGGCCSITPKTCNQIDLCHTSYCDSSVGCIDKPKMCRPPIGCVSYVCNPNDGFCQTVINNTCISPTPTPVPTNSTSTPTPVVVNPNCVKDAECRTGDDDKCINPRCLPDGNCYYNESVVCPDSDQCVKWQCVPSKGCVVMFNKTFSCDDANMCTKDSCDPKKGCVFEDQPCTPSKDKCVHVTCDKLAGCVNSIEPCTNYTGNCTAGRCYNETCHSQSICIVPPPSIGSEIPPAVVIGSSLGAAAVAAIVVCALLALFGLGGGTAFAISQAGAGGGAASTITNPLYKPTGHQGQNPLYRA